MERAFGGLAAGAGFVSAGAGGLVSRGATGVAASGAGAGVSGVAAGVAAGGAAAGASWPRAVSAKPPRTPARRRRIPWFFMQKIGSGGLSFPKHDGAGKAAFVPPCPKHCAALYQGALHVGESNGFFQPRMPRRRGDPADLNEVVAREQTVAGPDRSGPCHRLDRTQLPVDVADALQAADDLLPDVAAFGEIDGPVLQPALPGAAWPG